MNIIKKEPTTWTKKYLILISYPNLLTKINGKNNIKEISRINQYTIKLSFINLKKIKNKYSNK